MTFPTLQQVEDADREQLCRWHRQLPSAMTDADREVQDHIHHRYIEVGGFTPELSKQIGWPIPTNSQNQ